MAQPTQGFGAVMRRQRDAAAIALAMASSSPTSPGYHEVRKMETGSNSSRGPGSARSGAVTEAARERQERSGGPLAKPHGRERERPMVASDTGAQGARRADAGGTYESVGTAAGEQV